MALSTASIQRRPTSTSPHPNPPTSTTARLPSKPRRRPPFLPLLPPVLLLLALLYHLLPAPPRPPPHPHPPPHPSTPSSTPPLSHALLIAPPSTPATSLLTTLHDLRLQAPTLPVHLHLFGPSSPSLLPSLQPALSADPNLILHPPHLSPRPYDTLLIPLRAPSGPALYLLAGARLSPSALSWLSAARTRYISRPDVAAFFLDHAPVRAPASSTRPAPDHDPAAWRLLPTPPAIANDSAFLYRLALGSAAFVPNLAINLDPAAVFAEWLTLRRSDWYKYPAGPGLDATPLGMAALPHSNWTRAAWNVWFSKFIHEYNLAIVYPRLPSEGDVLAWHPQRDFARDVRGNARPTLYQGNASWNIPDNPPVYAGNGNLLDHSRFNRENVQSIVDLAHGQGGVVSFTMANKIFLETARSWLCNVDVAGFRPRGLLWAVTDQETRDALAVISDSHTVLLDDVKGGKETGHEFGNPGYWKLMLERTALIGEILRHGVAVFAFETDAIWLEDPEPYIQELVAQDADVVGTINTRAEVSGNFFYLRPTLATRRMWDEITNEFEKAYNAAHFEKKSASSWTYIENDQSLLTKLVLRNETWRRSYPLSFLTLDMERFTDGRWYKPEEGFYTSKRAREPVVINNNFVIGVEEKTTRAKKWGHWFWDGNEKKCLDSVVQKAVRKSRKTFDETSLFDGHDGAHAPRKDS